jgi:anti-anti-sigma factor
MSELAAEVIPTEEGVLLRLGGTLGVAELLEFERVLDQVKVAPAGRLVVDLSGIRVLTSAGLGALLRMQTHFTRQECAVRLAAAPPAIDNLLRKAALDRVFTLASSVADAFA